MVLGESLSMYVLGGRMALRRRPPRTRCEQVKALVLMVRIDHLDLILPVVPYPGSFHMEVVPMVPPGIVRLVLSDRLPQ